VVQPDLVDDGHRVLGPRADRRRRGLGGPRYADPQVDQGARYTYDYQYEGCGNWPFNAAYAATYADMQASSPACTRSATSSG